MEKIFEFSIVIDIDNCRGVLENTVDSIISQSLNFIQNTEIIFIYHKSSDGSLKIINDYKSRYPENIIILNPDDDLKGNIHGKYTSFLNIKYAYPRTLLKKVKNSFKRHSDIDLVYIDEMGGGICDFRKVNSCIDFNLSQIFVKSSLVCEFFHEKLFIYSLIFENPKIAIVNDDCFEDIAQTEYDIGNDFFGQLIDLSFKKHNNLPDFCKRFILFEIQKFVESENEDLDLNILDYFDDEIIDTHESLKGHIKSFLIYLKNGEFHIDGAMLMTDDYVINDLSKNKLKIDIVEMTGDELNLNGSLTSSSYPEDISIVAVQKFKNNKEISHKASYEYYPTTPRNNKRYLGIDWLFVYQFNVSIPLTEDDFEISFKLLFNGLEMSNHIIFREFAGISRLGNYMVKHSRILLFQGRTFYLTDYSYSKMLLYEAKTFVRMIRNHWDSFVISIFYRSIYVLLFPFFKDRRIWLFSDRFDVAGDNSEYLFDYCVKQDDDVEKYFLMNKSSSEFSRLNEKYENIVPFGSFKHKMLYLFSEKIITSQVTRAILNPFAFKNSRLYEGVSTYDWCFIQHGVILHDLSSWIHKYNKNFYLFVTSSEYEYDSIVNGNYNYSKDRVQLLGLSRYDYLESLPNRQIVFAPTWRRKLNTERDIADSDYLKSINSFLTNERLFNYLAEKDYRLIFKPHPDLWKFIDLIDSKFEISDESYSEVFKSSSLMITDYSSVAFDFAYLKKPLLYYQTKSFDEFHYDKGYFDYETMGFGEIARFEEELVDKIIEYVDNDCQMKEKYEMRVDKFFRFRDKDNSKRIYEFLIFK